MIRLLVMLVCFLVAGVGVWVYVAKPFDGHKAAQNNDTVAGIKAEQKKPGYNLRSMKKPRPPPAVSRFAANPDFFYEPGEILISSANREIESAAEIYGFHVIEKTDLDSLNLSLHRLRTPAGLNVNRARRLLASRFPAASVDANHRYEIQQQESFKVTARAASDWSGATPTCGRGIRIGLIDGAVDLDHPALKGQDIIYRTFYNADLASGSREHGTAVAGMLVGKPEWGGLLPGAKLFVANIYGRDRDGAQVGSAAALAKGIDWLVKNKVQVIDISIAGAGNKVVHEAILHAVNKGVVFAAAAGNWGRGSVEAFPAAFPEVLAVTALSSDRKQLAPFSSHGMYVDFAAPGSQIWVPVPGGGRYLSGTSFAAPYVSVLAALYSAQGLGKSADKIRRLFRPYTVDMGAEGKDPEFGYGFVNIQPKCV